MAQDVRVVVGVEDELADLGPADEPLAVQAEHAAARQRRQRLRGEVGPRQRARVHPVRVGERPREPAASVLLAPRLAQLVDRHAAAVAVVLDPETRSSAARSRPRPGGRGRRGGGDPRRPASSPRPRAARAGEARAPRTPARRRGGDAAVNAIQRDEPDDAQAAHARSVRLRRGANASANAGSEAPTVASPAPGTSARAPSTTPARSAGSTGRGRSRPPRRIHRSSARRPAGPFRAGSPRRGRRRAARRTSRAGRGRSRRRRCPRRARPPSPPAATATMSRRCETAGTRFWIETAAE